MIHAPLSTTSVLDESAEVVARTAAPWAGVLMLTLLPYRFLQALYLDQLLEVGSEAARYGNLLGLTANVTVAAIVLAFFGRAVYARACRLAIARGASPGREAWRVPPHAFASYVLTGATALLVGYFSLFTVIGLFVSAVFAGIAIGTMELNERVSLTKPFAHIFRYTKQVGIPVAIAFAMLCALVIALANLGMAASILQWLVSGFGGFDVPNWQRLFTPDNRRFTLVLLAGAFVIVEPFWVAANVVYVRKAGAEERGDDLRSWFEELQRAS